MKKDNQFCCDNPGCENKHPVTNEGFPYEKNWTYLRNFNFKLVRDKVWKTGDHHFCCLKCMSHYLGHKIKKAMDHMGEKKK